MDRRLLGEESCEMLALLSDIDRAKHLNEQTWDGVIRVARQCKVAGILHSRIELAGIADTVPAPVMNQLASERMLAEYRHQMTRWCLGEVASILAPLNTQVVLLKGTAYIAQTTTWAAGRVVSDIDLMVRRSLLDDAEALLAGAGWTFGELSAHDDHYYRHWAHELPEMHHAELPMTLDLHHTILPVTSRARPDTETLFEQSVTIDGSSFRALSPLDQILHTSCHLFLVSDMYLQLRDVIDLRSMFVAFSNRPGFERELLERAEAHGVQRQLYYALRCTAGLFDCGHEHDIYAKIRDANRPSPAIGSIMDWAVPQTVLPGSPDSPSGIRQKFAQKLMLARRVWLQFPPHLLAQHFAMKVWGLFAGRKAV